MGDGAPHEARVERAERLVEQKLAWAIREGEAARRQDALARDAGAGAGVHERSAELHRLPRGVHEEAPALHATHADHERAGTAATSRVDRNWYGPERTRSHDERDRAADERERLADERDARADERDRIADG